MTSNLQQHAKKELTAMGLFKKTSDYGGLLGKSVMELITVFSKQGHSGFSAMVALELFNRLAQFKPLSEITDDPKEWMYVAEQNGNHLYQNRRCSSVFSETKGKTYYDIDEPGKKKKIHTSFHKVFIPKTKKSKAKK